MKLTDNAAPCSAPFVLMSSVVHCTHDLHLITFIAALSQRASSQTRLLLSGKMNLRLDCVRCYRDAVPRLCQTCSLTSETARGCLTCWR